MFVADAFVSLFTEDPETVQLELTYLLGVVLRWAELGAYIAIVATYLWMAAVVAGGFHFSGWADRAAGMMAERGSEPSLVGTVGRENRTVPPTGATTGPHGPWMASVEVLVFQRSIRGLRCEFLVLGIEPGEDAFNAGLPPDVVTTDCHDIHTHGFTTHKHFAGTPTLTYRNR